ncbi:MAG: hypothetical protein D6732_26905 [Methanobacteriota archaeon]|nr:MAG: hypothetical protein D6732_26905 [Euryarchaeota archaeon]
MKTGTAIVIGFITALIASLISLYTLIVNKDHQISNFRRKWAEELRNEVAKFISTLQLYAVSKNNPPSTGCMQESIKNVEKSYYQIFMMLNHNENSHKKVISILNEIREEIRNDQDYQKIDAKTDELAEATREVLKEVWDKVKSGEGSEPELIKRLLRWLR